MRDNLRLYHTILPLLVKFLPTERITRVRNLALMMVGLSLAMGVHLSQIAAKLPVAGRQRSLTNRLRRFVDNERVRVRPFYQPVLKTLLGSFGAAELRLIIDCTPLGFGFRLLTVAVAYRGRALPLVWSVHRGGKGHLKAHAAIELLAYVQGQLPADRRDPIWLLGDSGFMGVELLRWLRQHGWQFVIRSRGTPCVKGTATGGRWQALAELAPAPGDTRAVGWVRYTKAHAFGPLYVVIQWELGEDEPWYLLTTQPAVGRTVRRYRRRMWIEEMYGDMKGHGFDLESTHLKDPDRLSRLVLAVCWLYVAFLARGSWVVKNGYRARLAVKSRRDKSYFRLGWDWLNECLRLGQPLHWRFALYL